MSGATRRSLGSADSLHRYATLVAGELSAEAAPAPTITATGSGDGHPVIDAARERASERGDGPGGSLDRAMWMAAQELRPAPPAADRPGTNAPLPYREAAAPTPVREDRFDRRG